MSALIPTYDRAHYSYNSAVRYRLINPYRGVISHMHATCTIEYHTISNPQK